MPKLYNLHHGKTPQAAIYIGRPSMFGNPYSHLKGDTLATVIVKTREEATANYKAYFLARVESDPLFKDAVETLRGHDLACWCMPLSCHGDVILEYLRGT